MGISRKCVTIWLERFAAEGEPGMRDRSSPAALDARRASDRVEQQILDLRQS